jgi:hypothetical protein
MRTWVIVILVAGVLGFGGSAVLARAPSAVVSTPDLSEEAMDTSETKFAAELAGLGIELETVQVTSAISRDMAIGVAAKYQDERIAHEAQAVTAVYGRFSDVSTSPDDAPAIWPGTNRVMNNVPVWIVTFHGVYMLHSGPCMIDATGKQSPSTRDPYVFGDTNVVLDAETGEVLEGFSYNTSS